MRWIGQGIGIGFGGIDPHLKNQDPKEEDYMERFRDLDTFNRFFGDPRLIYNGSIPVRIKDHWYPVFKSWAEENVDGYTPPKTNTVQLFISMTIWSTPFFTLENINLVHEGFEILNEISKSGEVTESQLDEIKKIFDKGKG